MSKYEDDEMICMYCEFCDPMNDSSWCSNKKGARYGDIDYHIADTGCEHWKPCEQYKQMLKEAEARSKPSYGNGYIANVWSEWYKTAYRKGMIHE